MKNRARWSRVVNSDVLVVGIDVAKGRHVAACRPAAWGSGAGTFAFSNDREGFDFLLTKAEYARERQGLRAILFALEATGHYGHALRHYLTKRGYTVVGINPAHTHRAKELEDNSPEKSDPKDANVIADLASQGKGRLIIEPTGVFAELRRLGKMRQDLVVERIRLRNRYLGLIDLVFPELPGIVKNAATRTMRRLFELCPTPAGIVALGFEQLHTCLWRWSRGHVNRETAARIHRAAMATVGLEDGLGAISLEMKQLLGALEQVDARATEVEETQAALLQQVPYSRLLLSIPGLGTVTVATILGETGDLRQYRDAASVIKFAGYNLYTISSGSHKGKTRITKRGRPLLRQQLYLAACRMSKVGAPFGTFRQRLSPRKAGPVVMVGACRKLLRLMVALVRDGREYEPGRVAVPVNVNAVA